MPTVAKSSNGLMMQTVVVHRRLAETIAITLEQVGVMMRATTTEMCRPQRSPLSSHRLCCLLRLVLWLLRQRLHPSLHNARHRSLKPPDRLSVHAGAALHLMMRRQLLLLQLSRTIPWNPAPTLCELQSC